MRNRLVTIEEAIKDRLWKTGNLYVGDKEDYDDARKVTDISWIDDPKTVTETAFKYCVESDYFARGYKLTNATYLQFIVKER